MAHAQSISGGPSYSRDMWDTHGVKMITERIDRSKKSMKSLRDFFQSSADTSFTNAKTTHKLQAMNIGEAEFGTLKFVEERYGELIETMSKNEEILGSKIRTQCYQKLSDQITRITRVNTKLLGDLASWQKSLEREQKKLRKAKQSYDEKKKQTLAVHKALQQEKEHLTAMKDSPSQSSNKIPQVEANVMALQQKYKSMQTQSREQLEQYIKAVAIYRGFRLNYDSSTSVLLDQMEQTECDRAQMVHRVLKLYLEIQQVMVQQSLRNIDTISKHIANIDANSDNMVFVEKYRSNQKKPPLPDPKFHPDDDHDNVTGAGAGGGNHHHMNGTHPGDDDDDGKVSAITAMSSVSASLNVEDSAQTNFWCEKWRLVIGKILQRDIELVSPQNKVDTSNNNNTTNNNNNSTNESFAFIQLTDDEYNGLREKCVESLSGTHGRCAFSLIINRQRTNEYGLELQPDEFLALVEFINLFFDAVHASDPLDIKPAKLVMIMSQSLYVRKESAVELLTDEERTEFVKAQESQADKRHKLFIQDRIKNHEIWKMDKFWKEAYCDSVQQELLKYPAVKKWHSEQEQSEALRREQQIIFSQLAAWTHNMKEFGTDTNKIAQFLDSRGLKSDQLEVLKATLQIESHPQQENGNTDQNDENDDEQNQLQNGNGKENEKQGNDDGLP
eukprot:CAMPEP_0202691800 /NCGR_PEP_ID=MMETSP1385-20130828/6409_1 /ASSEMBLY_ACC=CAM_ASM_000861 /TAXON_ID=933848 /ORGANISM="Elphidium margaritaceum" /LENGTH=670 /DNA_ID=CAMNT_0049347253 /DNA_START=38 /DNA_END=2050 /DNA_ORIENTATION=-